MFLFNKNIEEDFNFMMSGIKRGILSEARVDEAVTRILATKASLGLHKSTLIEENLDEELKKLKSYEHEMWAKECADKSVTLVKDTALVYVIGIDELLRVGKIASNRDSSLFPLAIIGVVYLVLIGVLTKILNKIEKKYQYYN